MDLYDLLESDSCRVPNNFKARLAKLTLSKKKKLRKSLQLKKSLEKEDSVIPLSRKLFFELLTDDSSESEAEELNRLFLSQSNNNEMEKLNKSNHCTLLTEKDNASVSGIKIQQLSTNNIRLEMSDSDATNCSVHEFKNISFKKDNFVDAEKEKQKNIATDDTVVISISDENEFKDNICTEENDFKNSKTINTKSTKYSKKSSISVDTESSTFFDFKQNTANCHKETDNTTENKLSKQFSSNDSIFEEINGFLASSKKSINLDEIEKQSFNMANLCIDDERKVQNQENELCIISQGLNNLKIISPEKITSTFVENQNTISSNLVTNATTGDNLNKTTYLSLSSNDSNCYILDSEEEESVILVSDSENDDLTETKNYDNHVSAIRSSGETDLVSTMSNFKADRLQNFLKDCDIHPHEYPSNTSNDSLSNSICISNDNKSIAASSAPDNSIEIPETSSEADNTAQDNGKENKSATTEDSIEIQDSCSEEQNENFENIQYTSSSCKENEKSNLENSDQNQNEKSKVENASPLTQNNDTNNKQTMNKSNSFSSDSSCEEINVAATINIKIQITPKGIKINTNQSRSNSFDTEEFQENHSKKITPTIIETVSLNDNKLPSIDNVDESARKILDDTYGAEWQTPKVIKNLSKKLFNSDKKLINNKNITNTKISNENDYKTSKTTENNIEIKSNKNLISTHTKYDEILEAEDQLRDFNKVSKPNLNTHGSENFSIADFSLFHKNINPELESTRIDITPNGIKKIKNKYPNTDFVRLPNEPNTEKKGLKTNPKTKYGRKVKRWRNLEDSDTSTEISDDESIVKTDDDDEICNGSDSESDSKDDFHKNSRNKTVKKKVKDPIKNISKTDIVYLDLSNDLIKVRDADECASPAANNDPRFNEHLQNLLKTCTYEKKKLDNKFNANTKRKLFTPIFGNEEENVVHPQSSVFLNNHIENDKVELSMPLPSMFAPPLNKQLESVKIGAPIFKIPTPVQKRTAKKKDDQKTPNKLNSNNNENSPFNGSPFLNNTPKSKKQPEKSVDSDSCKSYGFLKSLGVEVPKVLCHPDALVFRENYKANKNDLTEKLYKIYNEKIFNNELDCPIKWNKKLINTAGRCVNKKKQTNRSSIIELSDKVLTSADRLRCTLVHELCHAATWIFNGEHGHGATWKSWATKTNQIFPELPKIGVCHQYEIEYKYTYKCTLCQAKSHAHSKSKKVENIRCSFCHGSIEVFLNKKDKTGNKMMTPVREPAGFAKFVREKYKIFKTPNMKHADVMRTLSTEFANLNVEEKSKY